VHFFTLAITADQNNLHTRERKEVKTQTQLSRHCEEQRNAAISNRLMLGQEIAALRSQ